MLALAALWACAREESRLPALGADQGRVSVSGLSSGAYMAGQFHFAHSKLVMGAGIVAGGPYGCAESILGRMNPVWPVALAQNLNRALNGCSGASMASLGVPDIERLARRARDRAGDGDIDPLEGLAGDRVYLFTGTLDRTVAPDLVRKAGDLYMKLGVPEAAIALVEKEGAGHGFVTEAGGNACGASRSPFLNDCGYDQAGAILSHIYGRLNSALEQPGGRLVLFAQGEFADASANLAGQGAVFIPEACERDAGCGVHVVFHGCEQGRGAVKNEFVEKAGYNRWAAANRLIVLYPQVKKSVTNPQGCWDWWGYTGPKFLTRAAPQARAVRAMLARLAEAPG